MSFENDYTEILKFAKGKAFGLQIEAEDLVNDAYINLHNKPYSIEAFYKEISNLVLIEKHNGPNIISYGTVGVANTGFTGDFVCKVCKQPKTAHEFRIETRSTGKKTLLTRCKVCENKIQLEKYHKVKSTDEYKKYNKNNFKKYLNKNRKNWNAYLRERYRLNKAKIAT